MTAWLLRKTASSVSADPDKSEFTVYSSRPPAFRSGDCVVLLGGYGKGISFDYSASLVAITSASSDALTTTTATVDKWQKLPDDTTLALLQFSLTAVKNFDRPQLHFRRAYRRLPMTDLQTIKSGEPFAERSAYYLLLRALPNALRESFERELRPFATGRARPQALKQRLHLLLHFVYV
jgi:hypothetical protein